MWKDLKKIGKNHVFTAKIESFSAVIESSSDVKEPFLSVKRQHFRAQKLFFFDWIPVWKNVFFRCKNHWNIQWKDRFNISNNCMKFSCFWHDKDFVKSSARISFVESCSMLKILSWTHSQSQCWWISIWCSFVEINRAVLLIKSTVCSLSQWITYSWPGSKSSCLKNHCYHIICLPACVRVNSSASVVEIVIIFCQIAC